MQTTAVDIRPSTVAEMREHAMPLLRAHWVEVGRNRDVMVLNPKWIAYEAMEKAGMLLALAAWDGEQLVGYSVTFVFENIHYSPVIYAQNDVIFVEQSARGRGVFARLMEETERLAEEKGAIEVRWHAKKDSKLDRILARSTRYAVQDVTYSRLLQPKAV